jgi:hypothetical protein
MASRFCYTRDGDAGSGQPRSGTAVNATVEVIGDRRRRPVLRDVMFGSTSATCRNDPKMEAEAHQPGPPAAPSRQVARRPLGNSICHRHVLAVPWSAVSPALPRSPPPIVRYDLFERARHCDQARTKRSAGIGFRVIQTVGAERPPADQARRRSTPCRDARRLGSGPLAVAAILAPGGGVGRGVVSPGEGG